MTMPTHPFTERFGKPQPAVPTDIRFGRDIHQEDWEKLVGELGAGWFMDGFLYLFGAGLQRLSACLDAWSFVVPPGRDRVVIGRNAHGALLVLEDPEGAQSVHLLDPFRVVYWTHRGLELLGLVGIQMPRLNLPHFFDDAVYREWTADGSRLSEDSILAPVRPLGLGGEFALDNFQPEEIVAYYQSTAPIYAKAFAKMAKAPAKRASGKKKGKR